MFNRINFGGEPKKDAFKNKPSTNITNNKQKNTDKNSLSSLLQKRQHPDNKANQSNNQGHKQAQHENKQNQNGQQQNNQNKQNDQKIGQSKLSKKEEKMKQKNGDLQNRIEEGLVGSKFRMMNEYFYTTDSKTSSNHFSKHKEDFLLYHQGFQSQIQKWPEKPVDMIIRELDTNQVFQNATVADLGCGDGKIYEYFRDNYKLKSLNVKAKKGMKEIHSYDLCSHKDFIKVADSKKIPLQNGGCDVVVFCLALMGTNYVEFLLEANRLIKINGFLIISEVNSRITDMDLFISMIECLGFKIQKKILPNTYFCLLTFKKLADSKLKENTQLQRLNKEFQENIISKFQIKEQTNLLDVSQLLLKPCIYKKR